MDRKKLFYGYTDFSVVQNLGVSWMAEARKWIPFKTWLESAGFTQIALWAVPSQIHIWTFNFDISLIKNFPYIGLIGFFAIKYYLMMFIAWLLGKGIMKIGLYRAAAQYNAKKEQLAPFNVEMIKQFEEHTKIMNALAKKVGIPERAENKFTEL